MISFTGSFGLTLVMVVGGLLISLVLGQSSLSEAAFISSCFSLSSTPLVVRLTSSRASGSSAGTLPECLSTPAVGILIY